MTGNVLIVEDDPALVHAISRNLSVRGYATESAMTLADALQAVNASCPALLLLDIDLPDGSGWDVLRALRAAGCEDTRVIVISALRPNARLAKELQCEAVLEKPFPMESLLRLVSERLGEGRPSPDRKATGRVGDIREREG